jgi:hypothetical protein
MSTINKRKEEAITSEESPAMKKLSRQARARKNKKQRREREEIVSYYEPGADVKFLTRSMEMTSVIDTTDIIFDPTRVNIAVNFIKCLLCARYFCVDKAVVLVICVGLWNRTEP